MVLVEPTSFHMIAILIESTRMWQRESNGVLHLLFNFLLRPYNMKKYLRNTLDHTRKKHFLTRPHLIIEQRYEQLQNNASYVSLLSGAVKEKWPNSHVPCRTKFRPVIRMRRQTRKANLIGHMTFMGLSK